MEPRLHLFLVTKLDSMCSPGGTSFEDMNVSCSADEDWHCETELGSLKRGQEKQLLKVQLVAIAVEGPELKESQKKVET